MMEISKGLRKEIMLVQNKLKNAIRDHQICMGKLEDNPNNADILQQIEEIKIHIISLGRCQKQIVQRLRKEVESFKAENVNGAKVSVASLLGLNHINNHNKSTNNYNENNSSKHVIDVDDEEKEVVQVKVQSNEIFDSRRSSKDNYEGVVRNGVITTASRNTCAKERSRSSKASFANEDVIEVSDDDKSYEHEDAKESEETEEALMLEQSELNSRQVMFCENLGLIMTSKASEVQNKRTERKRRSTANPQFVYSNWEIPTKRKRHAYLQSIGNAPQTRQTTARLNGPSPPPNKPLLPKSTSPPTKSPSIPLVLPQKTTTERPNILRNDPENQDSLNKTRLENGISESPSTNVKLSKAKVMHIPRLPSDLTIERIKSDTAVCIYCRNAGTLTSCDNCSISYHASCRSSSPPPSRLCSKCVRNQKDDDRLPPTTIIKNDELEEKERERYEQRERNSDLRLQVYELEKRSQLLGQSFQLQNRLRQDLLTKQEKTQKSIKRLVDFIKLMQLRPPEFSPPLTTVSTSFQPLSTSSPLHRVVSPVLQTSTQLNDSPISRLTPTPPNQVISNTAVVRALTPSSINQSSPISSVVNNSSATIRTQSSTLKQRKIYSKNHFSLSKKYPIHASVAFSVITSSTVTSPTTPTINNRAQESIIHYQCLSQEKNMISSVPRLSSTITSPVVAPSQPFETTKSPPPARYPDSSPSHPRKSIPSIATVIAATSLPWNQQQQYQQTDRKNDMNPGLLESGPLSPLKINHIEKNQLQKNWSEQMTSIDQTVRKNPVIYSTHCSQAITSPIPTPIVLVNHHVTIPITSHQNQSQIVSIDGSPKINPVHEEQETPPPNSPNT